MYIDVGIMEQRNMEHVGRGTWNSLQSETDKHEYVTLTNTHKKGRGPKYLKIVGVPLCQCSLNNRAQEGISCASDTLREWPMKGKTRSRNR